MKRAIPSIVCAALLCIGAQAVAEETMPKDKDKMGMMSKDEMMKECMKEQTAMNSGMSKTDMKKACDEKMKMKKDGMMKDGMKKPT